MDSRIRLRVIVAGSIGNLLEWYDFAIYGYLAAQTEVHPPLSFYHFGSWRILHDPIISVKSSKDLNYGSWYQRTAAAL